MGPFRLTQHQARLAGTHVRAVGGHVTTIKAVPQTYRGVRFRSTLEADWAASLDALRIAWSYEPEAVQLPSGDLYRPDFWLPEITTWLEVKGPHNDRIEKTRELARAVAHKPGCGGIVDGGPTRGDETCCNWEWHPQQLVVVGRAALYGNMAFEGVTTQVSILEHHCGSASFFDTIGLYICRACGSTTKPYSGEIHSPAGKIGVWDGPPLPMLRAPR